MGELPAEPLTAVEAAELLDTALAGMERSAQRLCRRSIDVSLVRPEAAKSFVRDVDELLDLAVEAEIAMQVLDRLYQHLSVLYFDLVGQDG